MAARDMAVYPGTNSAFKWKVSLKCHEMPKKPRIRRTTPKKGGFPMPASMQNWRRLMESTLS